MICNTILRFTALFKIYNLQAIYYGSVKSYKMSNSISSEQSNNLSVGEIRFKPGKVALCLEGFTLLLALISVAGQMLRYLSVYDEAFGLIPLTNISHALSIPTIYTVLLLFITSLMLSLISILKHSRKDKFRWQWSFLSFMFFYISLNKGTLVHSLVTRPVRKFLRINFPDLPRSTLDVTVVFLVLVLVCFYIKFLIALPKRTKLLILVSLAVYLVGFRGINAMAAGFADIYGKDNLNYNLIVTLKKVVEMSGMMLGIYTILDFLERISQKSI